MPHWAYCPRAAVSSTVAHIKQAFMYNFAAGGRWLDSTQKVSTSQKPWLVQDQFSVNVKHKEPTGTAFGKKQGG